MEHRSNALIGRGKWNKPDVSMWKYMNKSKKYILQNSLQPHLLLENVYLTQRSTLVTRPVRYSKGKSEGKMYQGGELT